LCHDVLHALAVGAIVIGGGTPALVTVSRPNSRRHSFARLRLILMHIVTRI
jgi:hypothetical protein